MKQNKTLSADAYCIHRSVAHQAFSLLDCSSMARIALVSYSTLAGRTSGGLECLCKAWCVSLILLPGLYPARVTCQN